MGRRVHTCTHIHTHTHVCAHMHIHTHAHVCAHMHIHTRTHTHTYTHTYRVWALLLYVHVPIITLGSAPSFYNNIWSHNVV